MWLLSRLVVFAGLASCRSIAPRAPHAQSSTDEPLPLPLIIWHGLGDNYEGEGLRSVGELAEATHPGTYVYYVHLAEDPSSDRTATFFGNVTAQIDSVCEALTQDPILAFSPAVDALGFSQGGQFLRGLVERCGTGPRVRSLVTFGSQHNGIAAFQNCAATDWTCKAANALLKSNTWTSFVQNRVVPAQYYRNPDELEAYLENSNFLADVNNERDVKNLVYRRRLMALEKFVLFMFEEDKTVIPKESAWFAEVNTTSGNVTWLKDREIYQQDWLGLKEMDEQGKLDFVTTDGGHMHLTEEVLVETFKKYFGPLRKDHHDDGGADDKDDAVSNSWEL